MLCLIRGGDLAISLRHMVYSRTFVIEYYFNALIWGVPEKTIVIVIIMGPIYALSVVLCCESVYEVHMVLMYSF